MRTVLLAALLLLPTSGSTAADHRVDVTPTTMAESPGGEGQVRATLPLGTVTAGTYRTLLSEVVVGDGRNDGLPSRVAVGHKITCQAVGGSTIPNTATQQGQVWSGQNLMPDAPDVTLTARMLFKPAVTGQYECLLRVYLNNGLASGYETARLRSGFLADVGGPLGPAAAAQTFGGGANSFFALGGAGKQLLPVTYSPSPGTTSFLAFTDLYATSCYSTGGNACPTDNYPPAGTAQVRYRTVATPSQTGAGCVAQATPSVTTPVGRYVHHRRLLQQLTVTLPATGCGTWTVNAYVQDNGGTLPFVIHGNPYSVTFARPTIS